VVVVVAGDVDVVGARNKKKIHKNSESFNLTHLLSLWSSELLIKMANMILNSVAVP
jgi:hypothetical protein